MRARVYVRVCGCDVVWQHDTTTTTPSLRLAFLRLRSAKALASSSSPNSSSSSWLLHELIKFTNSAYLLHQAQQVWSSSSSSSSSFVIKSTVFIKSMHQVLMNLMNRQRGRLRAICVRGGRVRQVRSSTTTSSSSMVIELIKFTKWAYQSHQVCSSSLSCSSSQIGHFVCPYKNTHVLPPPPPHTHARARAPPPKYIRLSPTPVLRRRVAASDAIADPATVAANASAAPTPMRHILQASRRIRGHRSYCHADGQTL